MLTSNVAEAYGFVRTPVADETDAPADLPDIEIIFATAPYVGEGLCRRPRRASRSGRSCCSRAVRGTIRLASSRPDGCRDHRSRVSDRPRGIDATMLPRLAECERLIGAPALRAVTTGGWVQPVGGER
jgi:choline dehydrogenase